MATLVLSTAGNALGGSVGGAIGALIGQSIDRELLAPPRRGPRVGDLNVQTSSYGTQVPRVYGTMRVAGSVVWATDLVEREQSGEAKGQPDVSYSYTVSFAVALSSRRASSVKRIWADGNLLRGAAGDLKVGGEFRFYEGGADQIVDPLIGSAEGIRNTPAYRDIALAVFEDLELASFGNRIPFLTFEVEADEGTLPLREILSDASGGLIESDRDEPLSGFAAYGGSIRDAVMPLIDSYGVELFDDGTLLRGTADVTAARISEDDLGNSADDEPRPRIQREKEPAQSAPASLRLTYYDPSRDYQTGEARALASEQTGKETQTQLPAVLGADDAKSLVHDMIARSWAARDRITVSLPPRYLGLNPGSRLALPTNLAVWTVETAKLDGFVVVAELRSFVGGAGAVPADGGRIVASPDIEFGPLSLALIDIPDLTGSLSSGPAILLAASSEQKGWRRSAVEIGFGGQTIAVRTAAFKSVLGHAVTALQPGPSELIDNASSVDIELIDQEQWLMSCDDEALFAGTNMAVIGREVIQFGDAVSLGEGRFRLSRLLRARGGTEWASAGHMTGETFCLLDAATLQRVALPNWTLGGVVTALSNGSPNVSMGFAGANVRPLSPVNLAAERTSAGDLQLSWIRRSRLGYAWVDGIDAPLGEAREQYRLVITCAANSREYATDQSGFTVGASDLAELGSGTIVIEVQQVGDFGTSPAARLTTIYP